MGFHGNHACTILNIARISIFIEDNFGIQGVRINNLAPMKIVLRYKVGQRSRGMSNIITMHNHTVLAITLPFSTSKRFISPFVF